MATAAELLLNASSGDDTTLVIDNYLRTIAIPKRITNLGVVADDDVLRLNFRMPRYLDDTDLSTFSIRINYVNAKGEGDAYTVSDKVVGDKHITFSWLVGPTATAYKGETKFIVCMKTLNSEGYIEKEYNTTIATLPVLEGLEVDEQIVEAYSDIIEQWRRELFGIGDTEEASIRTVSQEEQENIAQKGIEVLATIPEDYQTTYKNAEEAARTKADAIVNTVQGETVSIPDSSDDYLRGLRVFGKTTQVTTTGKNLARNELYTMKTNGLTIIVHSDKTFTVNGTATAGTFLTIHTDFNPGAGEYILSGCPSTGGVNKYILYMTDTESGFYTQDAGNGYQFTHPGDISPDLRLAIYEGVTVNNALFKPMIRLATIEDGTYEPYSGGVASPAPSYSQNLVNVGVGNGMIETSLYGKNLFNYNDTVTSKYYDHVMTAILDHGVISVTGTSMYGYGTLKTSLPLGAFKKGQTYQISRVSSNFHGGFWFYDENDYNLGSLTTENSLPYTIPENADHMSLFYAGITPETEVNLTEKFMLNLGTESLPWEPSVDSQSFSYSCPNGLPGIKVNNASLATYTDSASQHWVCDEIDFGRGVYIQRIGHRVLDGVNVRPYHATHSNGQHYCTIYPGDIAKDSQVMSSNYTFVPINWSDADLTLYGIGGAIIINDNRFNSADDAVSLWSNELPEVQYVLATPVETPLTAEEIVAYKALCTNYPNTTVINDSSAWMELKYNVDTKTYLDNLPKATDEQVQASVNAWLEAHFTSAEGVSF